jgi:NitT/TauT family transport system permease protein
LGSGVLKRQKARGPGHRPNLIYVWILRVLIAAVIIAGWQHLTVTSSHWRSVLSTPRLVGNDVGRWVTEAPMRNQMWVTLTEAAYGYLEGLVLAIALVVVVNASSKTDRFLRPFIAVLAALPKLALTPLFLVWFGISLQSKVHFIASAIFIIVFDAVNTGLKTTDPLIVDNLRVLGASRVGLVLHVYAPSVVTWLIASLRLCVSWALLAAVVSEYLGSTEGIGYVIQQGQNVLSPTQVLAGIVVVGVLAIVLDRALAQVENRSNRWQAPT